jgi:hypothetical protein
MSYRPPHEHDFAPATAKPVYDNEPTSHYIAPVHNPRTVVDIYDKLMQTPLITLSSEELFAIFPELRNRLRENITPKPVLRKTVSTHALIEQVPNEVPSSIMLNMQSVYDETHVTRSLGQSPPLCVYLSVCNLPDPDSSTFHNATRTPADSSTIPSDRPAPYTDLLLSTKEKYQPVAQEVHPAIGDLPDKFRIEHDIIGNPFDDLPVLYPDSPPFITTDLYTLAQRPQPGTNYPGSFWWPAEKDLMHHFILAYALGFAWSKGKLGSFRLNFFLLVDFPVAPHTPWVECIFPPFPRYYQHRRHSPSRDEAQFAH